MLSVCLCLVPARAEGLFPDRLARLNKHLCGQVVDYTNNHGTDNRIWSPALCQRRDLYVYLPPGYDCNKCYPFLLWMHGALFDEASFLDDMVEPIDRAIASGKLPPLIVAAPDGSIKGRPSLFNTASFFLNTKAGNFEDFIIQDVWKFMREHYPIRPEREAHVLGGESMGGFAAFNLGIKYRDDFKVVFGIFPPLNLRWMDCHCNYMSKFDPCCWGWRTRANRPMEVVGRFYGVVVIRMKYITKPLFNNEAEAMDAFTRENPIEMIDRLCLHPGELDMYVAYAGKDGYNIDAQVESFLYRAKERGLCVGVGYDPKGRHNTPTALKLFPGIVDWLAPLLAPYSPCATGDFQEGWIEFDEQK